MTTDREMTDLEKQLTDELAETRRELEILEATENMRRKRERPYIERWRNRAEGRELSLPDSGKMLEFLIDEIEQAEQRAKEMYHTMITAEATLIHRLAEVVDWRRNCLAHLKNQEGAQD